jgi:hypothetical protein
MMFMAKKLGIHHWSEIKLETKVSSHAIGPTWHFCCPRQDKLAPAVGPEQHNPWTTKNRL